MFLQTYCAQTIINAGFSQTHDWHFAMLSVIRIEYISYFLPDNHLYFISSTYLFITY